ncbi:rRNA N6-adenosine-methyltransferase zcchc4 [Cichlidogyrus casuarinus]|uniref:rRNA N6-adenosine-methyltransferase zcchc4 n=1 Tax=Cichlidogyrus casuarinus TaxID=1844966 RepID=A0ABD2PRN8_9PLAT
MTSHLLDIDSRFLAFYGNDEFSHYNMINNHLIEPEPGFHNVLQTINESSKVLILCDPPFSAVMSILRESLERLRSTMATSFTSLMLILPYFTLKHLNQNARHAKLTMLDYRIDYCNHKKLSKASFVRIFTDLPPAHVKPHKSWQSLYS